MHKGISRNAYLDPITEEKLISLLKNRDRKAIDHIYANYSETLFGCIKRILPDDKEAQDCLQDSFVKIWQRAAQYDSNRGRLFTWMVNVCRNTAIDRVRSADYRKQQGIQGTDNLVSKADDRSAFNINPDQIGMADWIGKLDPEHRKLIDLAYFQGYTHVEIAEEQELPLGTVKTRIRTALKNLRQIVNP